MMSRPQLVPNVAASALLLVGLGDHPYGYYTLLRWVVTVAAGVTAVVAFRSPWPSVGWVFVGMAVLFNPVVIVGLACA